MGGAGASGVGDHEDGGSEGEAEGGEPEHEDQSVESPEFLKGDGGLEVRGRDSRVRRRRVFTAVAGRSHGWQRKAKV